MEEGPLIFHPPPLGPELRIYAERGAEPRQERCDGAHVASRFGRFAWNQENLSRTKLLSCAEKQAPDELILCLCDDNQRLGWRPRRKTTSCCSSLSLTCAPEPAHASQRRANSAEVFGSDVDADALEEPHR